MAVAVGMTVGLFGLSLFLPRKEYFSATRATAEKRPSTGRAARPRLYARVPSDEKKEGLSTVSQVRQRIESSFSGLWRRFADRVYSRSWRGPQASLLLKILDFDMERAGIIETV
jgi:hypothetical protein